MIVIVNNEPRILASLATALRRDGHDVEEYEKGTHALQGAEWSRVQLLITDRTNFPMDGVEFVRRVREHSNVPVVFVSAWADELEEELRGTEVAADDYIAVPFLLQNVAMRVRSVLERRGGAEA